VRLEEAGSKRTTLKKSARLRSVNRGRSRPVLYEPSGDMLAPSVRLRRRRVCKQSRRLSALQPAHRLLDGYRDRRSGMEGRKAQLLPGDGVLIEFGSVVGAVQCAIGLQKLTTERNAGSPGDRRME